MDWQSKVVRDRYSLWLGDRCLTRHREPAFAEEGSRMGSAVNADQGRVTDHHETEITNFMDDVGTKHRCGTAPSIRFALNVKKKGS
jgi:hypothetical protein